MGWNSVLIGRVRSVATRIPHSGWEDSPTGQAPNTLLAPPEAAIGEDANLQSFGPWAFPEDRDPVVPAGTKCEATSIGIAGLVISSSQPIIGQDSPTGGKPLFQTLL